MKIVKALKIKTIFGRLIVTFFAILIPLYIFGLVIYYWGMDTLEKEISDTLFIQTSFIADKLESEIKNIQILQYDCLTDDNLEMLATIPESLNQFDKTQAVLRFQKRLIAIKSSSDIVSEVNTYIPNLDIMITDKSIENGISDKLEDLITIKYESGNNIDYIDDIPVLLARFPVAYSEVPKLPFYAIEIKFSMNYFQTLMRQLDTNESSGAFIYETKNKKILADSESERGGTTDFILDYVESKISAGDDQGVSSYSVKSNRYVITYNNIKSVNMIIIKYVSEQELFGEIEDFKIPFWIYSIVAVFVLFIFSTSTFKFIHKPLLKLKSAFSKLENGMMDISIEHNHDDEFRYLYKGFNQMTGNLKNLIDQVYKQKIMTQKAELKQLQSQINPHFLYNSFYNLQSMIIRNDYDSVENFSKQLGDYFKFITKNEKDNILLDEEVNHARIYSDIIGNRFRNRIKIIFEEIPEEIRNIYVPRLIIQPIVENAFEHGLKNKHSGGLLRITNELSDGMIKIVVEDNGEELTDEMLDNLKKRLEKEESFDEMTGMVNTHKRLALKYGTGAGLTLDRGPLGGLRVTISFPFGTNEIPETGQRNRRDDNTSNSADNSRKRDINGDDK